MREQITYKWSCYNATDFANWMTTQMTNKVLSEFWLWYRDVTKAISRMSDGVQQFQILEEVGAKSFDSLPLPTLDTEFSICGKRFAVRDAFYLSHLTIVDVAKDMPDSADGWNHADMECLNGVHEFAYGFFCGVVRGMLD